MYFYRYRNFKSGKEKRDNNDVKGVMTLSTLFAGLGIPEWQDILLKKGIHIRKCIYDVVYNSYIQFEQGVIVKM